jgi:lia operon protein LiaF
MGEETKNNRNRNTAIALIGAGLFLLLDHTIGFFPIVAGFLILIGIQRIRIHPEHRDKLGYVLVIIGAIILLGNNFAFVVAVILIALGYFFLKSKQVQKEDQERDYVQKHKLIDSVRLGKEPWILKNSSMANVIGEINIDLSLAILEQRETTLIVQGVIGDIDIIVPEDIGISVTSSIVFGQIDVAERKEAGIMNKLHFTSANFESCEHRVKLIVSYLVGDVDIKIL